MTFDIHEFNNFFLPVCTPIGFIRLFSVIGQVLVKPTLLRDVNEEFQAYNLEEASVKRKLESNKSKNYSPGFFGEITVTCLKSFVYASVFLELRNMKSVNKGCATTPSKLCGNLDDLYFVKSANSVAKNDKSLLELQVNYAVRNQKYFDQISYEKRKETPENVKLFDRLRELETERNDLDKQRSSSCFARNLIYPLAMLLLLLLTSITVLLVVQNTIELLIGIKALPLSSRVSIEAITSLITSRGIKPRMLGFDV